MTSIQVQKIVILLILPQCDANVSETSKKYLQKLVCQAKEQINQNQFNIIIDQWKKVGKKFKTNEKLTLLKETNLRIIIIQFVKEQTVDLLNISYFNRAKIDDKYIKYLKELKTHLFMEVLMIVNKLKIIHNNFYESMSRQTNQFYISKKIQNILSLCNQKKRSINNNKYKFLSIVEEDPNDRLELIKHLGKLLRASWKQQNLSLTHNRNSITQQSGRTIIIQGNSVENEENQVDSNISADYLDNQYNLEQE